MLLKLLTRLENRLHTTAFVDTRALSVFRIIFALYFLLFFQISYSWIGGNPDIFFIPPQLTIAALFSKFPSPEFFKTIDILIPMLLILLLFGYKTRYVTALLSMIIIISNSFMYSFGHIQHYILIELTLLLMVFSNWGRYYSIDYFNEVQNCSRSRRNYSLSILALCIGFGFFSAGIGKAGWFDFDLATQGVRTWLNRGYYLVGRQDYLAKFFIGLKNRFLWEILDYITVLFEVTFIAACFTNRKIFRFYLSLAVIFHFIIYLMLNINFSFHLIIFGAFIDWHKLLNGNIIKFFDSREFAKRDLLIALGIVLFIYISLSLIGLKYQELMNFFERSLHITIITFAVGSFISIFYILSVSYYYISGKYK